MTRQMVGAVLGGLVGGMLGGLVKGGGSATRTAVWGGVALGVVVGLFVSGAWAPGIAAEDEDAASSAVVTVASDAQFDQLIRSNRVVLVDFYADWCGPCRALKPTIHAVAREYKGRAVVASVNVDQCRDLAARMGVRGIPDVRLFRDGKRIEALVGARKMNAYTEALDKALK